MRTPGGLVGKLGRKNLILDVEELRELARRMGLSESAAVRDLIGAEVRRLRAVADFEAAMAGIEARGGFAAALDEVPDDEVRRIFGDPEPDAAP